VADAEGSERDHLERDDREPSTPPEVGAPRKPAEVDAKRAGTIDDRGARIGRWRHWTILPKPPHTMRSEVAVSGFCLPLDGRHGTV
jgi:hypothetical protein